MGEPPTTLRKEVPEEYDGAEEILRFALYRIRQDVKRTAAWVEECIEQLEIARMCHHEAVTADVTVTRLLKGDLYRQRPEADAEPYWPDEWPDGQVDIPLAETPEVAEAQTSAVEDPPPEQAGVVLDDLPPELIAQLSPKFVAAHTRELPAKSPARGPYRERLDYDAIRDKIVAALPEMLAKWPTELNGQRVSEFIGERAEPIYTVLRSLATAGTIQYVRRLDCNQIVVLMPGTPMPHADLSKKQQAVFDFLAASADAEGVVSVSERGIQTGLGFAKQTGTDVIIALERKGYIEIVHRGDNHQPATYRIPESHRPSREALVSSTEIEAPPNPVLKPEAAPVATPDVSAPTIAPDPDFKPEKISPRKLAYAKELIGLGYTVTGAAAKADVCARSLRILLDETP